MSKSEKARAGQVKKYLILLLIITTSGDNGAEVQEMGTFEVAVAGVGIDCRLVLIDFKEKDLSELKK